jgi:hypothetical protein
LSDKITASEASIAKLERQIMLGDAASARITALLSARADHYRLTFAAIVSEEEELRRLYEPLKAQIDGQPGALGKLTFNVRRTADAKAWADHGETLLDTRKAGPFRGKGALLAAVQTELLPAWETGSAVIGGNVHGLVPFQEDRTAREARTKNLRRACAQHAASRIGPGLRSAR